MWFRVGFTAGRQQVAAAAATPARSTLDTWKFGAKIYDATNATSHDEPQKTTHRHTAHNVVSLQSSPCDPRADASGSTPPRTGRIHTAAKAPPTAGCPSDRDNVNDQRTPT